MEISLFTSSLLQILSVILLLGYVLYSTGNLSIKIPTDLFNKSQGLSPGISPAANSG